MPLSRVSARTAFLGTALFFLGIATTLLLWAGLVESMSGSGRILCLFAGVLFAGWGIGGPGRMGWSDKRFPTEVRQFLQTLGIGGLLTALCLWAAAAGLATVGLGLAAVALGFTATAGILRMRQSLPDDLTIGEIYENAKSAGVFGGATADNSTLAFNRWAPGGADGVAPGSLAPDGTMQALDGTPHRLREWLARDSELPVVLNFGSYSCPHHRKRTPQLHALHARWAPQGVRFLTVYTAEAHPEDGWALGDQYAEDAEYTGNPEDFCFLYARSIDDRREMAQWLIDHKDFQMPVMLDTMDDNLLFAYNSWPIRLYVVHQGVVVYSGAQGPFGYEPPEVDRVLEVLFERMAVRAG